MAADITNLFPNKRQFDTMNALLAMIASKSGEVKLDSWYAVQQVVRMGGAPTLFPVGTQIMCERAKVVKVTVTGSTGISAASVEAQAFIGKMGEAHGGIYEFTYDGYAWHYNGEPVILGDYGITVTGTAKDGDKIVVREMTEKIVWDVVAHDYNLDPHNRYDHSMTLLTHECMVHSLQYDAAEALYYCEDELPAGVYHFTVSNQIWHTADNGKNYQFTLTKSVPAGGQLVLSATYNQALEGKSIKSFNDSTTTTAIETATLSEGSGGTSLVTPDEKTLNMNHMHRALLGSNNWKESAMRQFLNSDAAAGSVWTPQTKFDRPPSWVSTQAGWMNGLDPQFLEVVGTARIVNCTNDLFEIDENVSQNYTTDDKFWLASKSELFGATDSRLSDGKLFPYYEGATNADRIKYNMSGAARSWWLRSPLPSNTLGVRFVSTDGSLYSNSANYAYGVAAACVIF